MLSAAGYNVVNLGTDDLNTSVDYPDVAATLADAMLDDKNSRGIIICGTGAGVMIAANRYRHIRASRCDNPSQARDDRYHDDTNVLALAADDIDIEVAFLCAQAFLESPFDDCERRVRRVEKIS
jgi:ribose 5-phosphate isomerase B